MKRADYLARVQTLEAELAMARRELERVTGQRDELRKVIGDVRSYARQEAERAVADNLSRRDAANQLRESLPLRDYIWASPDGNGWVDAWNGWYPTYRQALQEATAGVGTPWVLRPGEGILAPEELERRRSLIEGARMRPTVGLAAHLNDPEPVERPVNLSACYHPAEDSSVEAFWHRCHGDHNPCGDVHG